MFAGQQAPSISLFLFPPAPRLTCSHASFVLFCLGKFLFVFDISAKEWNSSSHVFTSALTHWSISLATRSVFKAKDTKKGEESTTPLRVHIWENESLIK